jgi:hypothetical protein
MKTREVFRIVRRYLDCPLTELGFSTLAHTGAVLPWSRRLDERQHETVWCQIDKWPWDPWLGSKFTVEFQCADTPDAGAAGNAKRARLGDLLDANARKAVQDLQNAVIAKLRVPTHEEYNGHMGFAADEFALAAYRDACQPVSYTRGRVGDLWLRIFDAEDVDLWGAFLAEWIPQGLTVFEMLEGDESAWG